MNESVSEKTSAKQFIREIWEIRRLIVKSVVLFFCVGLIVALTANEEFESSSLIMPETGEPLGGSLGSLGGLAGLAGVSLNMGGNGEILPDVYPKIVKSTPFLTAALNAEIYFGNIDQTISSREYFSKIQKPSVISFLLKYTLGLPKIVKALLTDDVTGFESKHKSGLIRLSENEMLLLSSFAERIRIEYDDINSLVTVAVEMPDPYAAASLTQLIIDKLTERVIALRIEKAERNLDFIQERYNENKIEYQTIEKKLAIFTDANKNFSSSLAEIEFRRLQNDYQISYEVYKSLASQLEQAKIKVKEDTPIFTVLQPVEIPVFKSKPKRLFILVAFIVLGALVPLALLKGKEVLFSIKKVVFDAE